MSSFFGAVSSQAFMQNAIVGGILASVAVAWWALTSW